MKQIALDIGSTDPPSFDSFAASANEPVLAHLRLWTTHATRSPVPTYLWGESGSGKTHLLMAAERVIGEQGARVGWLDATVAQPPPFDESWAAVVMDDVQAYSAEQQHAAFTWFVEAQTHQRWVLAAGVQPPADLPLREDLRTRLGWGHVFAIQPLAEPEARAALRREADRRALFFSDDVMDYLLTRFARDLKHLMALLDRLDEFSLSTKRAITVPLLKQMLLEEGKG